MHSFRFSVGLLFFSIGNTCWWISSCSGTVTSHRIFPGTLVRPVIRSRQSLLTCSRWFSCTAIDLATVMWTRPVIEKQMWHWNYRCFTLVNANWAFCTYEALITYNRPPDDMKLTKRKTSTMSNPCLPRTNFDLGPFYSYSCALNFACEARIRSGFNPKFRGPKYV